MMTGGGDDNNKDVRACVGFVFVEGGWILGIYWGDSICS